MEVNPYISPTASAKAATHPRTESRFWAYFFLFAPIPLGVAFWFWATNFAPSSWVSTNLESEHRAALIRFIARIHILAIAILCHFPAFVLFARSSKHVWLFGTIAGIYGLLSLPAAGFLIVFLNA